MTGEAIALPTPLHVSHKTVWTPQPGPQTLATICRITECFYGGAIGGGKTDWLIGDFGAGIEQYGSAWNGILFRKTYDELEHVEKRCRELFGSIYGIECWSASRRTWSFPSGATLKLRYLDKDIDVERYQGHEYTWAGFDELTQWSTDYCYTYLFTRLRSASGAPCYLRGTSNPGGVGHCWVKDRFMSFGDGRPCPPGTIQRIRQDDGSIHKRVFIPAKLEDNQILLQNDPGYRSRAMQISDPVMRRALLEGDWDIFAGQAFPEWNKDIHIIPNQKAPKGAEIWRSMDWGYEKPYCCLWLYPDYDGNVTVCNESYGSGDKIGQGSRESAKLVRQKIERIENDHEWWVKTGKLDPQCWAQHDDEPSIFDNLGGAAMGWEPWSKGPGSRVSQKQMVHQMLAVTNNKSQLRIMKRCHNLIRTLPALPRSLTNLEDVDTNAEDHAYDALRGALAKKIYTREERRKIYSMQNKIKQRDQKTRFSKYGGH